MYQRFLEAIEKNAGRITKNLLKEIHARPETWHYLVPSDEVTSERISRAVKNVYERLGNWLKKDESKNMLFTFYMNLGAERCQEGIALEQVTMVLLLIKREIWNMFRTLIVVDNRFPLNQFVEINYYVNLFFVRAIQSTIAGYRNNLAVIAATRGREKQLPRKAFRI